MLKKGLLEIIEKKKEFEKMYWAIKNASQEYGAIR